MKEIQILNNGESLYNIRTKINNNFETVKNSENIVYNPDKTNIVANNVQDAIDRIGNKINENGDKLDKVVSSKQNNLIAGKHISINNDVISANLCTSFTCNSGNVNSSGEADLINAVATTVVEDPSTVTKTVNQQYYSAGSYTFNAPVDGFYTVAVVGGGGNGGSGLNAYAVETFWSGGSGAGFVGELYLAAGNHTVVVGGANGGSSIDNLVVAGAGGDGTGGGFNLSPVGGSGGTLTITGQVQNASVQSNGNSGTTAVGLQQHVSGGASVYNGYGAGGASNGSPTGGVVTIYKQYTEQTGSSTVVEGSATVTYKIGGNFVKVTATDFSGETFEVSGLNSDDVSSLADGTYVKYIAADSSSELIKAPLLKQPFAPSSPTIGTVWLNTSCEPVSAQKYNGSAWEVFYKVPLGQITVSNGVVADFKTFPYSSREVSSASAINNLYPDVVIKEYVNDDTGSWYKIYASGYVEQGGFVSLNNCEDTTVVFPIPMKTYLNGFFACTRGSGQDQYAYQLGFKDNYIVDGVRKGIAIRAVTDTQVAAWWKVCGKVA